MCSMSYVCFDDSLIDLQTLNHFGPALSPSSQIPSAASTKRVPAVLRSPVPFDGYHLVSSTGSIKWSVKAVSVALCLDILDHLTWSNWIMTSPMVTSLSNGQDLGFFELNPQGPQGSH